MPGSLKRYSWFAGCSNYYWEVVLYNPTWFSFSLPRAGRSSRKISCFIVVARKVSYCWRWVFSQSLCTHVTCSPTPVELVQWVTCVVEFCLSSWLWINHFCFGCRGRLGLGFCSFESELPGCPSVVWEYECRGCNQWEAWVCSCKCLSHWRGTVEVQQLLLGSSLVQPNLILFLAPTSRALFEKD